MPVVPLPPPHTTPSPTPAPLAVPPAEVARLLSLSVSRIYQLMRRGELQSYEDGRTRRITMVSVHAYIARRLAVAKSWWMGAVGALPATARGARRPTRTVRG